MTVREFLICVIVYAGWITVAEARPPDVTRSYPTRSSGKPVAAIHDINATVTLSPEVPRMAPAPAEILQLRKHVPIVVHARGMLSSIQVNVDSLGNNIVGDAANEPSIAIDPMHPNRVVIAWRQFDSILSDFRQAGVGYSVDGGQSWSASTLDSGIFRSDPVLGADNNGNIFFYSLGVPSFPNTNIFRVDLFKSLDGGVSWLSPIDGFGGDKQWIVVDQTGGIGNGNIYAHWSSPFSCCGVTDFTRSADDGASFESPVAMPAPSFIWGTLDVGSDGTLYQVGATLNPNWGHVFARSTNAKDPAQTPAFDMIRGVDLHGLTVSGGINPSGLLGQVWIAVDRSGGSTRGNVYILGSVFNAASSNVTDVMFIRSTDGGDTWSTPVRVNDDPTSGAWHWFGTMSVAPNGRIDVIWNDTRNDPGNLMSEVTYSSSLDGGVTWSTNTPVSPAFDPSLGYPQQQKIGDYYDMISDNGGANLAYSATFNGEEDVYFLRIPADCNGNNVADSIDIVNLTSQDCNGNQTPDECELNLDCNNNGTQDICDVAAGAADCNGNLVPDTCELNTDCNHTGTLDICDLADGTSQDCNKNGSPDECDIASGIAADVNGDGIPDECLGACCFCFNDACIDTSAADCSMRNGIFSQLGTTCATFVCPNLPLANDHCQNAEILPNLLDQAVGINNHCATLDGPLNMPCELQTLLASDLWYSYTAPCDAQMTVSLCDNANFDTVVAVYADGSAVCSCPADNVALAICGDDTCGPVGGPSTVTTPVTSGSCYTIRVGGWNGVTGTGQMNVSLACLPGACCMPNGLCTQTSEPACNASGGSFAGTGLSCGADVDHDGIAMACDNCPAVSNVDQADFDGDGLGDACDDDTDADGVPDTLDQCRFTPSGTRVDGQGRPLGDIDVDCDTDLDDFSLFKEGFTGPGL